MKHDEHYLAQIVRQKNSKLIAFFLLFFLIISTGVYAQQDFRARINDTVRGDVLMIANTILGVTSNPPNNPYNVAGTNNGNINTSYIDIDNDNTTFSSSSADLLNPNTSNPVCPQIVYAGLYWTANYYMARAGAVSTSRFQLDINNGPFSGDYDAVLSNFGNDSSVIDPSLMGNLVVAERPDCWTAFTNAAALNGNIAVVQRSYCSERNIVIDAQNAGAIGVIVVNDYYYPWQMSGTDFQEITIPSIMIGNDDIGGQNLVSLLQSQGGSINASIGNILVSNVRLTVNNTTIAGVYAVENSNFSNDNSDVRLLPASSNMVVTQPVDGCGITNGAALSGNIAIIREGGSCSNRDKVVNAQNAGAIGVIIVGNSATAPAMTGNGTAINIPSVAIGNTAISGQDLITLIQAQNNVVNATISTQGDEITTGLPANDPRINGTADYRDILLGFGAPGSVNYVPVQPQAGTQTVNTGTGPVTTHSGVIYDGYANTTSNPGTTASDNVPYTCYADVTSIVQANGFGTYTVANMKATLGVTSGVSGAAGGWTLVVFYDDPTPTSTNVVRFVSSFDGFREIQGGAGSTTVDLTISGFQTLPAPLPVNVRFGVGSLEGDNGIPRDRLLIENASGTDVALFDAANPADNFFNSSISVDGVINPNRNPASTNTLGFDSDIFEIDNSGNQLINNGATTANFTMETDGDTYQSFLALFSIENIIPKIRNIKEVLDPNDLTNVITNSTVELSDILVYRLSLLNTGNEDIAGDIIVEDVLPANVDLQSIDGIDVTVQPNGNLNSIPTISYTVTGGVGTQIITFTIPPDLLEQDDAEFHIDMTVQLVADCESLRNACSNEISNLARTTYTGILSGITVINDPSSSRLEPCGDTDGLATNFLANVPPCELDTPFCGGDLTLIAGEGYNEYQWSGPGGFTAVRFDGDGELLPVNFLEVINAASGIYTVIKIDTDASDGLCMTLTEQFDVEDFSNTPHPLQDNAAVEDNVEYFEACNVPLAKINLCGTQTYTVDSGFDPGNLVSIVWQELTETTCLDRDDDCPAVTGGCDVIANWTDIPTAPKTTALNFSDAGEYRMIVEFSGGCTELFYFDINKNDYQPMVDILHMECGNDGSITVNNVASSTLAFLIRPQGDPAPTLPGDIGLFTITPTPPGNTVIIPVPFQNTPFLFTVYAIDTAFPNCVFSVDGTVNSSTPTFTVTPTDPTCADDTFGNGFGSVQITVTDGLPDYEYNITGGPNNIDITSGNGDASNGNFTFNDLQAGTYTIDVISNSPAPTCVYSEDITINPAPAFIAEVVLVTEETCDTGAIVQVNVTAGSGGPYTYSDSSGVFTSNNQFEIPRPADPTTTYTFQVSDTSSTPLDCIITADITGIEPYVPFTIDNVVADSAECPGDTGTIEVTVSSGSVVAGRTYTYQLWDCAGDPNCNDPANSDPSLWILLNTIGPTINETVTFVGLIDRDSYAVTVSHNVITDPAATPICPQQNAPHIIRTATAVQATVATTRELSCITGQESAQVTINGFIGGSGTYEWSTAVGGPFTAVTLPDTVVDFTGPGNYTIFVRDPNATTCPFSQSFDIDPLATIDDITYTSTDVSCPSLNSDITLTAQPPLTAAEIAAGVVYQYSITPDPATGAAGTGGPTPFSTTNTYTFAEGITYTVIARRSDTECVSSPVDIRIDPIDQIAVTGLMTAEPICTGDLNGSLSFTVNGVNLTATTYSYVITGGDIPITPINVSNINTATVPITGLGVGTYTVVVTDDTTTCDATVNIDITEPAIPLTFTSVATDSNCNADTGTITVTASGGRGNYQYRLVDSGGIVIVDYPNTNNSFTGLADDTYTIFVRDGNDPATACEINNTQVVGQFASPSITLDTGGDQCYDGTDQASQWVTITPGAGVTPVGPFEYILDRGAGPEAPVAVTFLASPPANTFEIDNLTPGTYTVFVRNTNTQCISNTESFTINPELTITATLDKDIDCNGDAIISFTASDGSGTYTQYDLYDASTATPTFISTITTPPFTQAISTDGEYVISVLDDNGCTAFSNPITVTPYVALNASHTATDAACNNETGTITVNIDAGGIPPYTYELSGATSNTISSGSTSVTFTNVNTGTHSVLITDSTLPGTGCPFQINNINIDNPDPIVATIDEDYRLLNCTATPDAQIQITNIIGGSLSYEWSLDNVTFTAVTAVPFEIPFTTDGSYTLYVRNQTTDNCTVQYPITIDPRLEITDITFAESDENCANQIVTVIPTAIGDAPASTYTYTVVPAPISGDAISGFVLNLGTTYTFTATRGDNQCFYSEDFRREQLDEIQITNAVQTDPVSCNEMPAIADGALSFTVANAANFSYTITGGPVVVPPGTGTGTTPVNIGSLEAGTYTITVTDTNLGGIAPPDCQATTTVTITQPDPLTVPASLTAPLTCVQNATITANAAGGNGGYQYTLVNSGGITVTGPQSSGVFSIGTAETYTVTVTDAEGCTANSLPIDVVTPTAVTASVETTSDRCFDTTNQASLDITINTGTAPFSYTLNGGSSILITGSTFTVNNLTPGAYTIVITDTNGCDFTINETIADQLTIAASLLKDLDCSASPEASIQVTTTGGNGGNTFEINTNGGGFVTYNPATFPFTTLADGTYQFAVIDSEGCRAESAIITVTPAPDPTGTVTPTHIACNGASTGIITFSGIGSGTPPIQTSIDGGTTFSSQTTYGGLVAGTYDWIIRDAKLCEISNQVTINEPAAINARIDDSPIDCNVAPPLLSTITVDNVTGGTVSGTGYTYTLFNADGTIVTAASLITANPTTTTATSVNFQFLDFGEYYATVTDENGCTFQTAITTVESSVSDFDFSYTGGGDCLTGAIYDIQIINGTPPFTIEFEGAVGPIPTNGIPNGGGAGSDSHQESGLLFGFPYNVIITDTGGCQLIRRLDPPEPSPSGITALATGVDMQCNADSPGTGGVDFTVDGYTVDVTLDWEVFNSDNTTTTITGSASTVGLGGATFNGNIGTGLAVGNYFIVITESGTGAVGPFCTATAEFLIGEPTPLGINFISQQPQDCNDAGAEVVVVGTGGTPPYTYTANPGGIVSTNGVFMLPATVGGTAYTITVDDANSGCTAALAPVTVFRIPDPTIDNISVVVDPCIFDGSFEFTVTATGQSQLEFGIDDGDTGTTDSPVFVSGNPIGGNQYNHTFIVTGPSVDQYTITVRDTNGCIDTDAVIIHPQLFVDADFSVDPTCFNSDSGTVTATVTGGSSNAANWTVVLVDTDTGLPAGVGPTFTAPNIYTFTNVPTGNYEVTVTDTNAVSTCSASDTFSRADLVDPIISTSVDEISCIGASDGSILVSIQTGTDAFGPYTYELYENNGGTQGVLITSQVDNPLFTGLSFDAQPAPHPIAGEYLVIVRSSFGCEDSEAVTLVNPTDPTANVSLESPYGCTGVTVNFPVITLTNPTGGAGTPYRIEYTITPSGTTVGPVEASTLDTNGGLAGIQIIANEEGDYTFTIYDANNCSNVLTPFTINPFPIMTAAVVNQVTPIDCNTNTEEVTVTVTGGTGTYDYEEVNDPTLAQFGINSNTSNSFFLPGVGTYQFIVTDTGTGCSILTTPLYEVLPYDTIEATISLGTPAIDCFGDTDGVIELEVTGHTGNYNYVATNLTNPATVTGTGIAGITEIINTLGFGDIQVTVTDLASGCSDDSNIVFLPQPEELQLTVDGNINANCNQNGRVLVSVTGGTPPYTYSDGTNTTTTNSTTFEFSLAGSLAPGTSYTLTVTDANSCSDTENENVVLTPDPTLDPLTVDDVCTHDGSYVITATGTSNVTGGTGALQFQLNGGVFVDASIPVVSHEFTVSTPGTYTVTARDENGCITNTESITILPELTASATFTADPTCRDFDGTITVTVNGGSDFSTNPTNFTFELDGTDSSGASFNVVQVGNNIFTNVSPGNYTVIITDVNDPSITTPCSITINVTPPDVPEDPIITVASTAVSCIGVSDGTVTIALDATTMDDGPYTYQLFVDTGGGTPGAQVGVDQIDNPIFTDLPTGDYVVLVMSDSSCSDQETINVPNATQVIVTTAQTPYSCAADNSSVFPIITVTIVDGTPPYSISYDTPLGTTVTATAITDANGNPADGVQYEITANEEGDYDITVTDANGCATVPPTIIEPVLPFPIMTNPQAVIVTDITCTVDEEIEVSVQGGSTDFTFAMIDNSGTVITPPVPQTPGIGVNTVTFTVPRDLGIYTFRITDNVTGCTIDVTHEIDEYDFIAVTAVEETPETCLGAEDGTVRINISGYIGTYDFQVLEADGVTPVTFAGANGSGNATSDPFTIVLSTAFPQGSYVIQITETASPECVELSNIVTVTGPSEPLVATINEINTLESCDPASDGSFQVSVTGVQGIVTYELFLTSDVGFTTVLDSNQTGLFENLTAEDYTVRASDGNACVDTAQTVINPPNPITLNPLTKTDITCFGDANGTITATATGGQGAGTYLFILTRPNGTSDAASSISVFQNLGPGIYSVIATDNLGCDTAPLQIEILEPSELTVNFMVDRNVTCPDPTVDVTVSGTSDVAIVEYVLVNVTDPLNPIETSNGNNTFFSSIPIGDYQFYVRDVNGCTSPLSGGLAVIPIPQIEFTLDLTAAFISCTDANNAVVNIEDVTGGTGDYTFTLTGTLDAGGDYGGSPAGVSQATTEFRDLPAGNYTYTVTTDRQCTASETFQIINPPLFEPVFTATSVSCNGEDDGMIRIEAIGGTPPYAFAIGEGTDFGEFLNDESDGMPNEHTFEDLIGGITYTVLAQDSRGCQEIQMLTIDEPEQLMVALDGPITPERCFGESNGAFTITISGGTAPYETNITNNDADYVQDLLTYDMLPGGITTVFIRDANNCRISLDVEIPEGAILDGILQNRMDCPIIDVTTGIPTQDPVYYIDFLLSGDSVVDDGTNIRYTLTPEGGAPIVQLTPTFTVMPDINYQGMMTHIPSDCTVDLGTIRIDEYVPLNSVIAVMTNNPQDPNEYEINVQGGSGDYTYYVALIPEGSTVNDLRDDDYRELDDNIFSIRETGDYALRVIDNMGCEIIAVQRLTYINIIIPNYFTPDGDGTDDLWYPDQITPNPDDPFFFANMEVKVFDRYGRLLAEFVGDQQGWDGIYQGKSLPSGDYWYTIILNDIDNREFTGHFTLYR